MSKRKCIKTHFHAQVSLCEGGFLFCSTWISQIQSPLKRLRTSGFEFDLSTKLNKSKSGLWPLYSEHIHFSAANQFLNKYILLTFSHNYLSYAIIKKSLFLRNKLQYNPG